MEPHPPTGLEYGLDRGYGDAGRQLLRPIPPGEASASALEVAASFNGFAAGAVA
jgi:hypothetical protein